MCKYGLFFQLVWFPLYAIFICMIGEREMYFGDEDVPAFTDQTNQVWHFINHFQNVQVSRMFFYMIFIIVLR